MIIYCREVAVKMQDLT